MQQWCPGPRQHRPHPHRALSRVQVGFDQFIHHPLMYFPVFYVLKELVNGGEPIAGLQKYRQNIVEDLTALWKLWLPTTVINFSCLPMWGRIPWVAGTSLLWTCILSYMRGSAEDDVADAAVAEDMTGNLSRATQRTLIWRESQQARPPPRVSVDVHVSHAPATCHVQAAFYDERKTHLLLSANGPDRIGYIHTLSSAVAASAANVNLPNLASDIHLPHLASDPPSSYGR